MTIFRDKSGKEISAADFCKGREDLPARWTKQVKEKQKAAPIEKKEENK